MLLHCLRLCAVFVVSLLALSSLRAQEAIETPKPREESSPEPTPEPTKSSKTAASSEKPAAKSLEETMRPEEFKAAGLDKLSEDELQHLDAYLQGYRESAKKKATQKAQEEAQTEIQKANEKAEKAEQATQEAKKEAASSRTKLDQLVSRVDGSIDGVKGRAIIRLEDGTVWKQVNPDDKYVATVTDRPAATVMHTTFGYKMIIEGMPGFYVDPVVRP
jgi:predicted ribosome quality control (RQC) complex YloA/Tae2 family protein